MDDNSFEDRMKQEVESRRTARRHLVLAMEAMGQVSPTARQDAARCLGFGDGPWSESQKSMIDEIIVASHSQLATT